MDGTYKSVDQEPGLPANDPDPIVDEEAAVKELLTGGDPTKIKYTGNSNAAKSEFAMGKNGEAKVNIESVGSTNVGMGKDELMKYANEPFWIRLRMSLFVLFWVAWVAMLVGSVIIVILAPRCAPPPTLDWWQDTVVYQVYVKSYRDSNKDGFGDLKGIVEKLDYFGDLGVDTLLLSPIYPSPPDSDGYDVTDFEGVDQRYGSLEDFHELEKAMKAKGMKLILDFVPNHSSDKHEWFQASIKGEEPYKDYYIWADPKKAADGSIQPPNNWTSVYGGSAWTYNDTRKQYYLHQYRSDQPDLNLRNPKVKEELQKVLRFWLEKGIDGFRVVGASHLYEDEALRDEPMKTNTTAEPGDYEYLDHMYTTGQPETFELLSEWRTLLNNYTDNTGMYKVLLTAVYDNADNASLYYGSSTNPLADIPSNYELLKLRNTSTAHDLKQLMLSWVGAMPDGMWPNWVLGHHDSSRLATRIGQDNLDGIHMVVLLARGTPLTYYGDEIGMEDVEAISGDSRLAARTPMQWTNDTLVGFTDGQTSWAPANSDPYINVEVERSNKNSHLNMFRNLIRLRKKPAIKFGTIEFPIVTDTVFSMIRVRKGSPGYLVVLNLGDNSTVLDFSHTSKYLPESAEVELHSVAESNKAPALAVKQKVKLDRLVVGPKESAVLSFVPQTS